MNAPGIIILALFWLLAFSACGGSVSLAWDGVTNAASYKIYIGTNSRNYLSITNVGKVTNATVDSPFPNQTNFIAATTLATNGNESGYSAEVSTFVLDPNVYVYITNTLPWFQPQYGPAVKGTNWQNFGAPFRSQFTNLARAYLRLWNYSNQVVSVTILTNPATDSILSAYGPSFPSPIQ